MNSHVLIFQQRRSRTAFVIHSDEQVGSVEIVRLQFQARFLVSDGDGTARG